MTRAHAAVPAVLGLALLLSACAEGGPDTAAPSPGPALPDEPAALVLQVEHTGGFVSPETTIGRLPMTSVYADGRVVSNGPVAAIYPGFAWPNVQVQQADPEQVQALVQRALDAGVADTADLGTPALADAPSTRFTAVTAGGTLVREVYALGMADDDPALTDAQRAARAELAELSAELTDLPQTLAPQDTAPGSYEPAAVAVLARPWTAPDGDPTVGPPLDQPAADWPGPALPGEPVGPDLGCAVATGDQARAVVEAARDANTMTPWVTGDGARWSVTFRPLLPHESGCADLLD